jgi:hypothetical protein
MLFPSLIVQMLYFTLAYDWMFFSHQLENRVQKAEDIMLFCFYFLKFVKGENYNTRSRQVFKGME